MSNPIQLCLERLHLGDDDKIKQRAEQFQGQLSNLPIKLFSKGGPNCKSVISIQLAYESLQHYDWNIQLAAQLAGCKASAYESVLSMVRKQLNIQPTITFDTLLVALGSTTMSEPVKELWTSFQQDYLSQFKGVQKSNAQQELELPCWKGGIIYCCSKALGGQQLNKTKLHSLCACTMTELNKSIKIIQTTSQEKMSTLKTIQKQSITEEHQKKKNKNREDSNERPKKKLKPISGIVSMINLQDYKKTKKYINYLNWKSNLIQQLKET